MSLNSQLEKIRHIYLFENLDDDRFRQVAEHSRLIQLSTGDMLFSQGDFCHHFHVVLGGMIKLFRMSPDGTERVLELVGAKQLIGEDAMFVGQHSVHADALEPTRLIAIDSRFFADLLRETPELCLRLMTLMGHRSQSLIDEIGNLALQNAIQRVTQYLIKEKGNLCDIACAIRLNSPKQVIASRLGVKPETFSRIIAKLRNEGMIDCVRNTIVLKNVPSLQQVASGMICLKL